MNNIKELSNKLIELELHYGGYVKNIERRKVSPHDPRSAQSIKTGGMTGGDRMSPSHHNYAEVYSRYLYPLIKKNLSNKIIVEVGILRGSGLAVWSDIFPNNIIYGLDIDLSHAVNNMPFLKKRGAFKNNNVKLFEFDQLCCKIDSINLNYKIQLFIDDGLHTDISILNTLNAFQNYLDKDFVYIIEDNHTIHKKIKTMYPRYEVFSSGEITVLTNKS